MHHRSARGLKSFAQKSGGQFWITDSVERLVLCGMVSDEIIFYVVISLILGFKTSN
jgi:hypothetical protein